MINNIKRINLNHSFVFFLFCNIISLITFKAKNFSISPLICLFLILVIGVSHGSLDHIKGKRLLKIFDIKNVLFFYVSYILLAIFIILFWVLLPAISLLLFLVVASYHFGKEDTQFLTTNNNLINQLLFFFKGSLIILAPMFFHFDETVTIYKFLLVEDEAFYTILDYIETNKILLIGIVLSTLSSVLLFIKEFEIKKFVIFLDYFSIIILNYYLPPLVAFTLYFCFLHSLRHTITLIFEINNFDFNNGLIKFLKKALQITILTVIFSAHGVAKKIPEDAKNYNMSYVDATCPLVSKVHREAENLNKAGYHIILIGHKNHPEVIGTMGQLPEGSIDLVQNEEEAKNYDNKNNKKIAFVTQTTLSVDDTKDIIQILKKRFENIREPQKEDICYATTNRQMAVKNIAKNCDMFFIIGSRNSSNSVRLVEVAKKSGCENSMLIHSASEIPYDKIQNSNTIGISSGASAPEILVDNFISELKNRFTIKIDEVEIIEEDVVFKIPNKLN